jgi:hypothetical protein
MPQYLNANTKKPKRRQSNDDGRAGRPYQFRKLRRVASKRINKAVRKIIGHSLMMVVTVVLVACGEKPHIKDACDVVPVLSSGASDSAQAVAVDVVLEWVTTSDVHTWQCRGEPLLAQVASAFSSSVYRVLAAMLARGAIPNSMAADGRTALHIAALARDLDSVKVLIRFHADPNIPRAEGWTPLMDLAAARRDPSDRQDRTGIAVAKALIDAGAERLAVNGGGKTAIDIATDAGNEPLRAFLANPHR